MNKVNNYKIWTFYLLHSKVDLYQSEHWVNSSGLEADLVKSVQAPGAVYLKLV